MSHPPPQSFYGDPLLSYANNNNTHTHTQQLTTPLPPSPTHSQLSSSRSAGPHPHPHPGYAYPQHPVQAAYWSSSASVASSLDSIDSLSACRIGTAPPLVAANSSPAGVMNTIQTHSALQAHVQPTSVGGTMNMTVLSPTSKRKSMADNYAQQQQQQQQQTEHAAAVAYAQQTFNQQQLPVPLPPNTSSQKPNNNNNNNNNNTNSATASLLSSSAPMSRESSGAAADALKRARMNQLNQMFAVPSPPSSNRLSYQHQQQQQHHPEQPTHTYSQTQSSLPDPDFSMMLNQAGFMSRSSSSPALYDNASAAAAFLNTVTKKKTGGGAVRHRKHGSISSLPTQPNNTQPHNTNTRDHPTGTSPTQTDGPASSSSASSPLPSPSNASSSASSSSSAASFSSSASPANNSSSSTVSNNAYLFAPHSVIFERVNEIMKRDHIRQRQIAAMMGISCSTLSPMLKGKYRHTKAKHVEQLRNWCYQRDVKLWRRVAHYADVAGLNEESLAATCGMNLNYFKQWLTFILPLKYRLPFDQTLLEWIQSVHAEIPGSDALAAALLPNRKSTSPNNGNQTRASNHSRPPVKVEAVCDTVPPLVMDDANNQPPHTNDPAYYSGHSFHDATSYSTTGADADDAAGTEGEEEVDTAGVDDDDDDGSDDFGEVLPVIEDADLLLSSHPSAFSSVGDLPAPSLSNEWQQDPATVAATTTASQQRTIGPTSAITPVSPHTPLTSVSRIQHHRSAAAHFAPSHEAALNPAAASLFTSSPTTVQRSGLISASVLSDQDKLFQAQQDLIAAQQHQLEILTRLIAAKNGELAGMMLNAAQQQLQQHQTQTVQKNQPSNNQTITNTNINSPTTRTQQLLPSSLPGTKNTGGGEQMFGSQDREVLEELRRANIFQPNQQRHQPQQPQQQQHQMYEQEQSRASNLSLESGSVGHGTRDASLSTGPESVESNNSQLSDVIMSTSTPSRDQAGSHPSLFITPPNDAGGTLSSVSASSSVSPKGVASPSVSLPPLTPVSDASSVLPSHGSFSSSSSSPTGIMAHRFRHQLNVSNSGSPASNSPSSHKQQEYSSSSQGNSEPNSTTNSQSRRLFTDSEDRSTAEAEGQQYTEVIVPSLASPSTASQSSSSGSVSPLPLADEQQTQQHSHPHHSQMNQNTQGATDPTESTAYAAMRHESNNKGDSLSTRSEGGSANGGSAVLPDFFNEDRWDNDDEDDCNLTNSSSNDALSSMQRTEPSTTSL